MADLSALERAVLEAIAQIEVSLEPERAQPFADQIASAQVVGRTNTGAGMFVDIAMPLSARRFASADWQTTEIVTTIGGIELHCFVFVRDGFLNLIEGYIFDGDTTGIDFLTAPFSSPRSPI